MLLRNLKLETVRPSPQHPSISFTSQTSLREVPAIGATHSAARIYAIYTADFPPKNEKGKRLPLDRHASSVPNVQSPLSPHAASLASQISLREMQRQQRNL